MRFVNKIGEWKGNTQRAVWINLNQLQLNYVYNNFTYPSDFSIRTNSIKKIFRSDHIDISPKKCETIFCSFLGKLHLRWNHKSLLKSTWSAEHAHSLCCCVQSASLDNSLHDARERNSKAITPNIHTKPHTVRGRPTLKLVERFGNGSVREHGKVSAQPHTSLCIQSFVKRKQQCKQQITFGSIRFVLKKLNFFFFQAYRSPLGYVVM